MEKVYSKHWSSEGFTLESAQNRKAQIDFEHQVGRKNSQWLPAEVELDPHKQMGYRIICKTKPVY